MKIVYYTVAVILLSTAAFASLAEAREGNRGHRPEIRQDMREIREDRRELRRDKRELREDVREHREERRERIREKHEDAKDNNGVRDGGANRHERLVAACRNGSDKACNLLKGGPGRGPVDEKPGRGPAAKELAPDKPE